MNIKTKSRIIVFILSFIVWILITLPFSFQELVFALVASFFVALIVGDVFLNTGKSVVLKGILYFLVYIMILFWEMLKANFHVAMIVIHPEAPIKPGFVKVKTELKEDSSITVLANSITLTPGTLTVDVFKDKGELIIHWIQVETPEIKGCTEAIAGRFEPILRRFMR
ncbi:cation antiporter [Kosmotoga arenicorallina S304]|uniref:Cation antiporter n=1 Tax=Kosmotoga arenicorallina S304 TaxID=1453497 RepID=A0A176K1I2_9BACT|nr:Na+/H+ antiporter subunit E [Kosmotoga arenicorallina]OAA30674.1 cation antiporter [Kosmotoga arenicorallina S304]